MSLMRLLVVVVVYERLQWGILSVYMFLESYCSNCIWFVMRNLLLILLMVSWEIIKVGDYEYFVHDDLSVQFFWFNLIEKKNREKQWVLAQMLPHLHQKKKKKNTNLHWLCVLRWSLCSFECFNWEYYLIAVHCLHQVAM